MRYLTLALFSVFSLGCGDDPSGLAGEWSIETFPAEDDCALYVMGKNRTWTIEDGDPMILYAGLLTLRGGERVYTFDDSVEAGRCNYSGEARAELDFDGDTVSGVLKGYLRYSNAQECGQAAINGPIRCDFDVEVRGHRADPGST